MYTGERTKKTFKEFFKLTDLSKEQESIAEELYKWYLLGYDDGYKKGEWNGYYGNSRNNEEEDIEDA